MSLYFITGNSGKFKEIQSFLPDVQQIDIDLEELQEIDPHKIIEHKLHQAFVHQTGEFIVEDTSLYLDCMNGLPGPLIKWFLKAMGVEGVAQVAVKMGNTAAVAKTIIGYARSKTEIHFFEGEVKGNVVMPRGNQGFGWDPIFQPVGETKTFAEMTTDEKAEYSMRKEAALKLKNFLR